MAALASTDEVASSLCSASIEWGICIATPANRLPTAPTVTLYHVTRRCAPCLRVVAAASRIRAAAAGQGFSIDRCHRNTIIDGLSPIYGAS